MKQRVGYRKLKEPPTGFVMPAIAAFLVLVLPAQASLIYCGPLCGDPCPAGQDPHPCCDIDPDPSCFADPRDAYCGPGCDTACATGVEPHPCCTIPTDPCCGNPDSCGQTLVEVAEGESVCFGCGESQQPLQIDLLDAIGVPNVPPTTHDLQASNSPLVSRSAATVGTPTPRIAMPTAAGAVDLVFGRPLVREVDFELPFGGATFRHLRTYGGSSHFSGSANGANFCGTPGNTNSMWDWNGVNWMMGESPILIIDAQYPFAVHGNPAGDDDIQMPMPERRCELIVSAHQSIPFLLEDDGAESDYVAPPWFDAILDVSTDGVMDDDGNWITRPSRFHVWLHRQAIKYTFRAHYEDVPAGMHTFPPVGATDGVPYYGLLTSIEDRQGNRVELEYCKQYAYDTEECPCLLCAQPFPQTTYQSCRQKGQLRSARLYAAGESNPSWTIHYYHQPNACGETCPWSAYTDFTTLRSIFVYKGEGPPVDSYNCFTVAADQVCWTDSLDALDDMFYPGMTDDWVIQVEYTYNPLNRAWSGYWYCALPGEQPISDDVDWCRRRRLLRTVVRERSEADASAPLREQTTLYRYQYAGWGGDPHHMKIYGPNAVEKILELLREQSGISDLRTQDIMALDNDHLFPIYDEAAGKIVDTTLRDMATYSYDFWDGGGNYGDGDANHHPDRMVFQGCECLDQGCTLCAGGDNEACPMACVGLGQHPWYTEFLQKYAQAPFHRAKSTIGVGPVYRYVARTGNPRVDGEYRLHYIKLAPELGGSEGLLFGETADLWMGHVPYYGVIPSENTVYDLTAPDASRVRHVAVIDRIEPGSEYRLSPASRVGLVSRRVVKLNAQMWVLDDRTYDADPATGDVNDAAESGVVRKYNSYGQLIEERSAAWGSEANLATQDSDGLIRIFEYDDINGDQKPDEIVREGVKLGTNGLVYYTGLYEYERPGFIIHPNQLRRALKKPHLLTEAVRLRVPLSESQLDSIDLDQHEVMRSRYELSQFDYATRFKQDAAFMGLTDAGQPRWSIQRERFNLKGQLEWRGRGTTTDPEDETVGSMVDFYIDHTVYNAENQPESAAIDTLLYSLPGEFERVADPDTPPLELTTRFTYDQRNRPTKVTKPANRVDWNFYNVEPDDVTQRQTWSFKDVVTNGAAPYRLTQPVQITVFGWGYRPIEILQVDIPNPTELRPAPDPACIGTAECPVLSRTKIEYDAFGRATGVEALPDTDTNGGGVAARITYDAFGQVGREQGPDGTITRTVRTGRGLVERIYRGTRDEHLYWGTAAPEEEPADNMVLVEKRYYGDGTTGTGGAYATGQLIEQRRYNQKPMNQYDEQNAEGTLPPNDENENGLLTRFRYDARLRPVVTETWTQPDENGARALLNRSVSWFDHLDRERIAADFGDAALPASIDPLLADITDAVPENATALLTAIRDASPGPLALRETLYNAAGQVNEERDYYLDGDLRFRATFYEFNGLGLTLTRQTTTGGTVRSRYNGLGWLMKQQTFASDVEIHRVVKTYDDFGNLLVEIANELRHDVGASRDINVAADRVRRYRHYWYDDASRLIATADYGTNDAASASNPTGTFENGSEPVRGDNPPPAGGNALITRFEYDATGRQYRVTDPAGRVTETEFDDLGRTLLVRENADGLPEAQRVTAHQYEPGTGRLQKIAAVNGPAPASYDALDWTVEDGSLQVTEYIYGADVINADSTGWTAVSTNGAWISAVHYPDPLTGQPAVNPTVRFRYRADGQVLERTDARGVVLRYAYDDRGNLSSIATEIPGPESADAAYLDNAWTRMEFAYTADNLLESARVYATDEIVSRLSFTYENAMRRLETVTQQVGDDATRTVTYDWEYAEDNHDYRLAAMHYPWYAEPVSFDYGAGAGGVDSRLSRLTSIGGPSGADVLYRYMGMHRMVSQAVGAHEAGYDDGAGGAVSGLDRFGRVIDIDHRAGGTTDLRYAYGYDDAGNRTFARIENAGAQHSWMYDYDALDRLIGATRGELNSDASGFAATVQPETQTWALDALGNWSGDEGAPEPVSYHRFIDIDGDGQFDASEGADTTLHAAHHDTLANNEIAGLLERHDVGSNALVEFMYDAVGNLVFDGDYFYRYDALNRLKRIHAAEYIEDYDASTDGIEDNGPNPWDLDELVTLGDSGMHVAVGDLLYRFTYDALSRRVVTAHQPESPRPHHTLHIYGSGPAVLEEYDLDADTGLAAETPDRVFIHGPNFPDPLVMIDYTNAGDALAGTPERLYYLKDALGSVGALANATGDIVERYFYDPYGATTVTDAVGNAVYPPAVPDDPYAYYHDHDFDGDIDIADWDHYQACAADLALGDWSSGAGGSGNDLDSTVGPWCIYLHDRNRDRVIDESDEAAFLAYAAFNPADPSADPLPVPAMYARPPTDPFDIDGDGWIDLYDFSAFQTCYNSSFYLCAYLFDTNASAHLDLADHALLALKWQSPAVPETETPRRTASRFGNPFAFTSQRYDAVTNHYHFWRRTYSPTTGRFLAKDMRGLLSPIDVYGSQANAPSLGARYLSAEAEFMDGLNLFLYVTNNPVVRTDAFGLFTDWEIDGLIADNTGHRLYALGEINEGARWASVGLQTALGIAQGLIPGAGLHDAYKSGQAILNGQGGFWDVMNVAMTAFPIAKGLMGLRSMMKARRFRRRACNCFVAGTPVDTPDGPVPIEDIRPGDRLYSKPDTDPFARRRISQVTRTFQNVAPAVLWLSFSNGVVLGTTPGHEVWTFENGWSLAADLSISQSLQDPAGQPVTIVDLEYVHNSNPVYNLQVHNSHTYYANGIWVHNRSCRVRQGRINNAMGHSFEMAVREIHGIPVYTGSKLRANNTNFVPDFLANGTIGDIKSSQYVYMTPQLKAIADYGRTHGLQPILYVADKVSAPVEDVFLVIKVP